MEPTNEPVHEKKKKILHFSDGIEEVTDSEDGDAMDAGAKGDVTDLPIDETTMEWMPWLLLKSKQTGESVLSGCDYVGEFLASALGITSPKFVDGEEELRKAVEEQKEHDAESAEEIRELDTWKVDTQSTATTITEPTSPTPIMIQEETEKKPSAAPRY